MFPSYMLSNLYMKGSFKNTEGGFELMLKNVIDSGTITGIDALEVNDHTYAPDKITLTVRDRNVNAAQITNTQPFPVYVLSEIEISVEGEPLPAGEYKIGFSIHTMEAGVLKFTITDNLLD